MAREKVLMNSHFPSNPVHDRCRSCRRPILWAETEKGRRIPIDPQPVTDGNIVLHERPLHQAPLAIVRLSIPHRHGHPLQIPFRHMPTGVQIPKVNPQLELAIGQARATMTPTEALDHVVRLYGAEFEKANAEIHRQRGANDELFRIKQKVVIVNRGLMQKNHDLEERVRELERLLDRVGRRTPVFRAEISQALKPK